MKITPTITAVSTPSPGQAREFLQRLTPGQLLQGRVVDLPAPGTARLQIGLIELLARTDAALSKGQSLELEVKRVSPPPELKILNPTRERPAADRILKEALPKQIPIRELTRELQRLVRHVGLAQNAQASKRTEVDSPISAKRQLPVEVPRHPAVGRSLPHVTTGRGVDGGLRPNAATTAPTGDRVAESTTATAGSVRPTSPAAVASGPRTGPETTPLHPAVDRSAAAALAARTGAGPTPSPQASSADGPSRSPPLPATGGDPAAPLPDAIPKPLRGAIERLLRPAPQPHQLDGRQVEQRLRESGLYLEQQFSKGIVPASDQKLDLLRLLQILVTARRQAAPTTAQARDTVDPTRSTPPSNDPGMRTLPLPTSPPPSLPDRTQASNAGGLTELLLRLLTGTGRKRATASTMDRPSVTGDGPLASNARARGGSVEAQGAAKPPVQGAPADKDSRSGERDGRIPNEPPGSRAAAAQRVLSDRLLQLVEGGLARIQTHQAAALQRAEDGQPLWQFELPLTRNAERDEVLVRFQRERATGAGAEGARWTAVLRFEFDTLGSVEARLMLQGERLSSTFWCERTEAERRFAGSLPVLERGLQRVGLEAGRLTAVQGVPPDSLDLPKPPSGLLDTRV